MEGGTTKKVKQRRYSLQTQREWRSFRRCLYNFGDDTGVVGGVQQKHDRGSAPSSPAVTRSADSTPSKFNFFTKLSKKSKSGPKAEKKTSKTEDGESENNNLSLQPSTSQESLNVRGGTPSPFHYSSDTIKPRVHPTQPAESTYTPPLYQRSRMHVNNDERRRTENTLKIWIMEVKGVPCKKRYFCNVVLGNQPYRRTFSKTMSGMCFWGEYFELESIPQLFSIRIDLIREGDKRPSHKKIGTVEIDLPSASSCPTTLVDEWYAVKVDKQEREIPTLRIKHRFQSLDILPLPRYNALRLYLRDNATTLCQLLEPLLCVKAKEDLATALVNIMQAENKAIPFLVSLILSDIQRVVENDHLLLRGNSIATKAIEAYMRLVGESYLQDILSEPIQALISATEDLEVDPLRITNVTSLPTHREALKLWANKFWENIVHSGVNFPVELRRIFHSLRKHLSTQEKTEVTDNLISACVFLRFLCPAILYPSLFNITQEYPEEGTLRNLTLVAKTLQTLANFTSFRGKENFMEFLNGFIDKEQDRCRTYLSIISSLQCEEERDVEFVGQIDVGRHCALLHLHLADAIPHINTQANQNEAIKVVSLVEGISTLMGNDRKRKQPITCQVSSHAPIATSQLSNQIYSHINNNYIDDHAGSFLEDPLANNFVEGGMDVCTDRPPKGSRSQSYPRSTMPVYEQQKPLGTKNLNYFSREKTAANDLSTNDDYVLVAAINQDTSADSRNFLKPLTETNNNNMATATEVWPINGNNYYITEVDLSDSKLHLGGLPGPQHSPELQSIQRYVPGCNHGHIYSRGGMFPSRSHSVSGVPSPMERRLNPHQEEMFGRYIHPESSSCSQQTGALDVDSENKQGSQTSISQFSNIASSGYHSFAYSQSSSPVDSLLHTDNTILYSRENGTRTPPVLLHHTMHPSPLASPHHQTSVTNRSHQLTTRHPSYLRYTGHVSLHGTPRHISRRPRKKESIKSSLGSSQSVEDLSSFHGGSNGRRRNCSSSSSDSSPEPHPVLCTKSHLQFASYAAVPRTNPLCSPHLVHSPAFRQELQARIQYERTLRNGRRKIRTGNLEEFHHEDFEGDTGSARTNVGAWRMDNNNQLSHEDQQTNSPVSSHQILGHQETQIRAIIEKLTTLEQEFRHEQDMIWQEIHRKDVHIDDQAKKIAELDNANTKLTRTLSKLNN